MFKSYARVAAAMGLFILAPIIGGAIAFSLGIESISANIIIHAIGMIPFLLFLYHCNVVRPDPALIISLVAVTLAAAVAIPSLQGHPQWKMARWLFPVAPIVLTIAALNVITRLTRTTKGNEERK